MTVEFIDIPISGTYIEKHFGDTSSHCCWVKFTDSELNSWVGSFVQNWKSFEKRIIHFNDDLVLIIAYGNGYLLDCKQRKLVTHKIIKSVRSSIFCK